MHRRVVSRHALVVLRRIGGVRGVRRREPATESRADHVDDQQQAEDAEYDDQGDRHGAPAFGSLVMTVRPVVFQGGNRTGGTTGSRLRRQRVVAGHGADDLFADEPSSGLAGTGGARIRMPAGSLRMRAVPMVRAVSSTATYGTAAFVRLVTQGATFPAADQRRTARVRRSTLAKRAVVLVHDQPSFAVQIALHFRTDFLARLVDRRAVVRRLVENLRTLAGAHRAASFVLDEVAVEATLRRLGTIVVVVGVGRAIGRRVVDILRFDAAADGAVVFVVRVSVLAS